MAGSGACSGTIKRSRYLEERVWILRSWFFLFFLLFLLAGWPVVHRSLFSAEKKTILHSLDRTVSGLDIYVVVRTCYGDHVYSANHIHILDVEQCL